MVSCQIFIGCLLCAQGTNLSTWNAAPGDGPGPSSERETDSDLGNQEAALRPKEQEGGPW